MTISTSVNEFFSAAALASAGAPAHTFVMAKGPPFRSLPSLNAVRAFEVAARHMSFSQAGCELSVTQSAISRHIIALEDHLGFALFIRRRGSLELTEKGKKYSAALNGVFEHLYNATAEIFDGEQPKILNLNVLPTFAMKWLVPRLNQFTAANPKIELRMITSIRPVDFKLGNVDAAIRIAPSSAAKKKMPIELTMTQDWANVRSTPILTEKLVVVCSPALLSGPYAIRRPEDVRHHSLLHTRLNAWSYWFDMMGIGKLEKQETAAHEHFFITIQAAIDGKGVALIPRPFVESELSVGRLVVPFDDAEITGGSYHFMALENNWDLPGVRSFRDWLAQTSKGA